MATATLIAILLVYNLGLAILLFPFIFTFIGSLISKKEDQKQEKKGRTTKQVLANAGVAVLSTLLIKNPSEATALVIYVFAIALSDTMSSELGKKFSGPTYDICKFKKIKSGLSGGVSIIGTGFGLLGSSIMAIAALCYSTSLNFFLAVLVIGFTGMLVDSILGSLAQGKYQIGTKLTESGNKKDLVKGFHFIDNDAVNFLSILVTIGITVFIF